MKLTKNQADLHNFFGSLFNINKHGKHGKDAKNESRYEKSIQKKRKSRKKGLERMD